MLKELSLDIPWLDPPPEALDLIQAASKREHHFLNRRAAQPVPSFHCSNFRMTYFALRRILEMGWASPRERLIEWGSGLGVVSCQWATEGGDADGIEWDRELVLQAESLARERGLSSARFVTGNFLPESAWSRLDPMDDAAHLHRGGPNGYDLLHAQLHDYKIVFVYPWPGERRFIEAVFDEASKPGMLLLSFHGADELRLHQKR